MFCASVLLHCIRPDLYSPSWSICDSDTNASVDSRDHINEVVTLAKTLGVGLVTFGVLMASRVFEKWMILKRALALRWNSTNNLIVLSIYDYYR